MRERDPELSEGRLVKLFFLDKGNGFIGGVEEGVGTVEREKGEARGVASRGIGVCKCAVGLGSSSTFI